MSIVQGLPCSNVVNKPYTNTDLEKVWKEMYKEIEYIMKKYITETTDCFQITKVDLLGVSKEDIISVSRVGGNFTIKYNLVVGEDEPKEMELNINIPTGKVEEDTLRVNMLRNQLVIAFRLKDEFTRKEIEVQ